MARGRKKENATELEQKETEIVSPLKRLIENLTKRATSPALETTFIPTGVVPYDTIMGGFPVGHITLLSGLPGSGKTLLGLHAAANHIANGGSCLYIDTEGSLTQQRLESVGIPPEAYESRFFIRQYVLLEDCLSDVKTLLWRLREEKSDKPYLIVIDSLSSLLPHKWAKEDSDIGLLADLAVGGFARSGTAFLAGLPSLLKESRTALVITTQVRAEISMGGKGPSVKPFKFFALEHLSHSVIFLGPSEFLTPPFLAELNDSEKLVGVKGYYCKVKITVRKSQISSDKQKVIPPTFDFSLFYPIVDIPTISVKAGRVDNIFNILTYASLPFVGVLEKVVKPGVGTLFYFRRDPQRVVQFSYYDAYTNPHIRDMILNEVRERLEAKLIEILHPPVKGRTLFKEETKGDVEAP